MALLTDTDRLAMLRDSGRAITVQVDGDDVLAIFENAGTDALGTEGTLPGLTCRSVDVAGAARGAIVAVPGVGSFQVAENRPDGEGWSRIKLVAV